MVVRPVLGDLFHLGNIHPLLDSVTGGKQGIFHFCYQYGDCGWDDRKVVFELFPVSEIESDGIAGTAFQVAGVDIRASLLFLPMNSLEMILVCMVLFILVYPMVESMAAVMMKEEGIN